MNTSRGRDRRLRLVKLIAVNVAILGSLLIMIEGLASYGLFIRYVLTANIVAERRHTKYDPELGWVNERNIDIADMYGPGIYLRTNGQGFRNKYNFSATVPAGKSRIVCSGDSFTLGYGVDNDHTWCSLLSSLDPRLETVNMGQGGYGVDQSYLWYKRDAANVEHQVHLFAFITADFRRALSDSFLGYAKPILDLENDTLVVKNVPAPTRNYSLFRTAQSHMENLRFLRTVELLNRIMQRIGLARPDALKPTPNVRAERIRKILHMVFSDLKNINERRASRLVLIYLPDMESLEGELPQQWIEFIEAESRSLGIPLINFFTEFRLLPYREVVRFFIPKGQIGRGHLSDAGNEFVAKVVHDKLMNSLATFRAVSVRIP